MDVWRINARRITVVTWIKKKIKLKKNLTEENRKCKKIQKKENILQLSQRTERLLEDRIEKCELTTVEGENNLLLMIY